MFWLADRTYGNWSAGNIVGQHRNGYRIGGVKISLIGVGAQITVRHGRQNGNGNQGAVADRAGAIFIIELLQTLEILIWLVQESGGIGTDLSVRRLPENQFSVQNNGIVGQ